MRALLFLLMFVSENYLQCMEGNLSDLHNRLSLLVYFLHHERENVVNDRLTLSLTDFEEISL